MKREFSTHLDEMKMGSGSKLMEESIVATLVIFRAYIESIDGEFDGEKSDEILSRTNEERKEDRFIPRECYSRIFKFTREEIGRRNVLLPS